MHDAFEGGPESRMTRLEKDRQRTADNTPELTEEKPSRKKLSAFDIAISAFLVLAPLYMLGGYFNLLYIPFFGGLIYLAVQIALCFGVQNKAKNIIRTVFRVLGAVISIWWIMVIYPYNSNKGMYQIHRDLLISGDYGAKYTDDRFSLLPEKLPELTNDLRMEFVPHGAFNTRKGYIKISFYTNDEGITFICRNAAEIYEKAGRSENYGHDSGMTDTYRDILGMDSVSGNEQWFSFSELDLNNDKKFYYLNIDTGLCIIYLQE